MTNDNFSLAEPRTNKRTRDRDRYARRRRLRRGPFKTNDCARPKRRRANGRRRRHRQKGPDAVIIQKHRAVNAHDRIRGE